MKNLIISVMLIVLSVSVSFADDCVTKDELDKAIQFYETGYNAINNPPQFTTLECDPCKCPGWGKGLDGYSSASCFEFLAKKERDKEQLKKSADKVLERFRKHGICSGNITFISSAGVVADTPSDTSSCRFVWVNMHTKGNNGRSFR